MSDSIRYLRDSAGTAVGPYADATSAAGLVFVSGQAGIAPDGTLAPDIESQTRQTIANVAAILEAAGTGLSRVLRCGVYLTDIRNFERMNAVYRAAFGDVVPARTTVQVAALPLPGLLIEIDAVALAGEES